MSPAYKLASIMSIVANEYGISIKKMTAPNLTRHPTQFTEVRNLCIACILQHTNYAMLHVSKLFGYTTSAGGEYIKDWVRTKSRNDINFRNRLIKVQEIINQLHKQHV